MIWKGFGRKRSWYHFQVLCQNSPVGLEKITKNINQNNRSPRRDINQAPPEYEAGMLTTRSRRFRVNIRKERTSRGLFNAVFWYVLTETEVNCEKPQFGITTSRLRFEHLTLVKTSSCKIVLSKRWSEQNKNMNCEGFKALINNDRLPTYVTIGWNIFLRKIQGQNHRKSCSGCTLKWIIILRRDQNGPFQLLFTYNKFCTYYQQIDPSSVLLKLVTLRYSVMFWYLTVVLSISNHYLQNPVCFHDMSFEVRTLDPYNNPNVSELKCCKAYKCTDIESSLLYAETD
jgi:hypothetical protein